MRRRRRRRRTTAQKLEQTVAAHRAQWCPTQLAADFADDGQQPTGERHQDEGQHRNVVVPLAAVAFKRVGITIDVVLEIEAAEEGIALVEEDRDARARRWPGSSQPGQKKTARKRASYRRNEEQATDQ
jgi:hypothetical protein